MSPFLSLLLRWSILALGVTLASHIVPGINYDTGRTLVVVVLLLSFFNAVLKPLLVLFTLPFIVLTLGLGVVLINALLFLLVGRLVNGFHVSGFGSALLGAIIVSITHFLIAKLLVSRPRPGSRRPPPGPGRKSKDDDVIDI